MENVNPYQSPESELNADSTQEYYDPKIFAVNGRIGRVQYILYSFVTGVVFTLLAALVLGAGAALSGGEPSMPASILAIAVYLLILVFSFILARRRLNDVNRTGWLSLFIIIPFANLILVLYLLFARGNEGENNYGLPSKKSARAITVVVVVLGGTMVIGILASIALPAYQAYTDRVQQSQAK